MTSNQGGQAPQSVPFGRRKKNRIILGLLAVAAVFLWWWQRAPLPTDEEMIAHLTAHRTEFEELVRRHRTFAEREHWPDLPWPSQEQGTPELMQLAGISGVNYLALGHWLPAPYSLASVQQMKSIEAECDGGLKQWREAGGNVKSLSPPPPKCRLLGYQFGVLNFSLPVSHNHAASFRYVTVWKDYLHFPEPPRIEQGYLLGPLREDGQYGYRKRVASTLNYYPFGWKEYECVYRPIDAHWFLQLCNGH